MKSLRYMRWVLFTVTLTVLLSNAACNNLKRPSGIYTNNSSGVVTTIEFNRNGTMTATNTLGTQTYKWKMVNQTEISLTSTASAQVITIKYDPDSDVVTLEDRQYKK